MARRAHTPEDSGTATEVAAAEDAGTTKRAGRRTSGSRGATQGQNYRSAASGQVKSPVTAKILQPERGGTALDLVRRTYTMPDMLTTSQQRLWRKLVKERDAVIAQALALEEELRLIEADPEAAELATDVESGDCVASRKREMDLQLEANAIRILDQIDRALTRLEGGTYGVCQPCGKRIPKARLQALPYADLCVSCQTQRDRFA